MSEKLQAKLNRPKRGNRTQAALTPAEIRALLAFLQLDRSTRGLQNYALVFMAVTSGLRASELCSLRWADLDLSEGRWVARFTGKGGTDAEQELYSPAVDATREYFRSHFRRDPRGEDHLFWTLPMIAGQATAPLDSHALWARVKTIWRAVRAAGVITRELRFSPHLFRRSYATLLYRGGLGLKAIQAKTRHSNVEVLCKHYIDDQAPATPTLARMLEEGAA